MRIVGPPLVARWLVERGLPGQAAEAVAGDLEERFRADLADGVSPSQAKRRYWRYALASVLLARPSRDQIYTEERGMSRWFWSSGWASDVRHVVRGFAKSPAYVAVAVLSLAIGIGANVATLSVMRTLLLQSLPVNRPDELQWVEWLHPTATHGHLNNYNSSNASNYSYPAYLAVREAAARSGIAMLGFNFAHGISLVAPGRAPIDAAGMIVSADFFDTLGLPVALGRPIEAADEVPGGTRVAVISYDLWQRLFDGSPSVLGQVIRLNGVSFDIVGVTPRHYAGLSIGGFFPPTDVTLPLTAQPVVSPNFEGDTPILADRTRQWIHVIVRLRPGANLDAFSRTAVAGLAPIDASLADDRPSTGATAVRLLAAGHGVDTASREAAEPLKVLTGTSALVLLIACANLAGIMLARGVARSRETSVRRALGASRFALVRQWLIEAALLAGAGGAAGVLVAAWSGPALVRLLTTGLGPVAIDLTLDWNLVLLAIALTTVTALLSAAIPAWRLTGSAATNDLRTRVVGDASSKLTLGRVLIALQIAVSVPLLVGALLFVQTLRNLSLVDLGFDPSGLVTFQLNLPPSRTGTVSVTQPTSPATADFLDRLLTELQALPGVASATVEENALVSGITSDTRVTVDGTSTLMLMEAVGPGFFETMRLPIVAGRGIAATDVGSAPTVAVVNQAAVSKVFHGQTPLGHTFTIGKRQLTVVGVVADSVYGSVRRAPVPTFYDAYLQRPGGTWATFVTLRTTVAPAGLLGPIAAAVGRVDPTIPIANFKTQDEQIAQTTGRERVFSRLLTLFAGFAVVLACIGLHGLTSYAVARRTNEIGIRLALGARRTQVQGLMLRQVIGLVMVGLAVGIPLALLSARFVAALVFGVAPRDPITIGVVAALMTAAAIGAGWMPARRASRLEPLSALRRD